MRTALRLTKWYHRAHRRHFAANTACIVLFLCALQLSLMIRDGVLCAMEQSAFETYGSYTEVLYHVNPDALLQSREAIASSGSGVVSVTARIQTEESSVPLCLGTRTLSRSNPSVWSKAGFRREQRKRLSNIPPVLRCLFPLCPEKQSRFL